jgi:hypothetical protein
MAAERAFWAVWKDDRANMLSSDDIKGLSIDAESWANFMALLLRRRRFALMRVHNPTKPAERDYIKVLWHNDGRPPSFASLA